MTSTASPIPAKQLRNGFTMPVLGLGTWGMGGWMQQEGDHDAADIAAIRRAMDAGMTHIDTAERYAEGHAERLVGEAIRGEDRSRLFLVSKVSPEHLGYDDLLRSAEQSLHRLGTEYLDLYLIHDPNPAIPIGESMRAMDRLTEQGMIRHRGVSNFTVAHLEEAGKHTPHPIVANQVHYNLGFRDPESNGLLHYAKECDWLLIAWRPVRDVLRMPIPPPVLRDICNRYEKTVVQVALNWLVMQHNVVTLVKCGSPQHLDEALGSLEWSLSGEDVARLHREFPAIT